MSGQVVLAGFEGMVEVDHRDRLVQDEAERWLRALAPVRVETGAADRFFLEGYLALRARGWEWREAFCIVWLSLARDDRGGLATVAELCDYLGVSRMWFYEHKGRYENEPARGMNAWDWWAERLQLARLRGQRLAEVDEATYRRAVSYEGKAADRELYYKRAGVLVQRSEVTATVGQSVEVSELSDDELDALLARDGAITAGGDRILRQAQDASRGAQDADGRLYEGAEEHEDGGDEPV